MTYFPAGTRVRLWEFHHDLRPGRAGDGVDGYPSPIVVGSLGTVVNGTPDDEGDIRVKWDQVLDGQDYWFIHHTEVVVADPTPDLSNIEEVERWLRTT